MRHFIILTFLSTFTLTGKAQTHVKQAIDKILTEHPEWVANYDKNEATSTKSDKAVTQSNHIYQLAVPDPSAIDSLLAAFDTDKMQGYSYIRTSAEYNRANSRLSRKTITLQNGVRLESHSTEYSFVSLSAADGYSYRTNYIMQWFQPAYGKTEVKLYILYGPRPNNQ